MTIPIHAPNITVKFYPDSDHYTVSGWLRICNILLSYLVESLPFPWISRSERHLVRGGTRGERKSSPTTINEGLVGFGPLPGEYTSTPLDVHAQITQVGAMRTVGSSIITTSRLAFVNETNSSVSSRQPPARFNRTPRPGAKAEQEFLGLADQRQRSIVHCTHSEPITIDQWRSNHIVREHIVRMQVSPTMRDETLFAHPVTCDVSAVEI